MVALSIVIGIIPAMAADPSVIPANAYGAKAPGVVWEEAYNDTLHTDTWTITSTSDGGYLLFGYNSSYSGGPNYLVRLGPDGHKRWEKQTPHINTLADCAVWETGDGFLVTAHIGNTRAYVMKTDLDGNKLWDKTFANVCKDPSLYSGDWIAKVFPAGDGYVVIGSRPEGNDPNVRSPFLVTIDKDGNRISDHIYPFHGYDSVTTAINTSDGGYLILSGSMKHTYHLTKTDASGNAQWQRALATVPFEFKDMVELPSGGYALVGYNVSRDSGLERYDAVFVKMDAGGVELWNKSYRRENLVRIDVLANTRDGGLVAAGFLEEPYVYNTHNMTSKNLYVLKMDGSGNVEWEKTLVKVSDNEFWTKAGEHRDNEVPVAIGQAQDGSYLIFSHSGVGTSYVFDDLYIVRLNSHAPAGSTTSAGTGNQSGCLPALLLPVLVGAAGIGIRKRGH